MWLDENYKEVYIVREEIFKDWMLKKIEDKYRKKSSDRKDIYVYF